MCDEAVELAGALGSAFNVVEWVGNSALCPLGDRATDHVGGSIHRLRDGVDPVGLLILGVLLELEVVVDRGFVGRVLHGTGNVLASGWELLGQHPLGLILANGIRELDNLRADLDLVWHNYSMRFVTGLYLRTPPWV